MFKEGGSGEEKESPVRVETGAEVAGGTTVHANMFFKMQKPLE